MQTMENEKLEKLAGQAAAGDRQALEEVVAGVQGLVFNLALRMLGTFPDAEDAAQEILLKIVTGLPSFRGESAFSTWVFRVAVNHLLSYRKHMFAERPLSFEFYGYDIENGRTEDIPDLTQNVERGLLAEELKLSCTNVMLQCLDPESRCIFVLGTMFRPDSRDAGEILGMTPEAYRQRLSRVRRKVADFLSAYCGEYGGGQCRCAKRVDYAIQNHRLHPAALDFTGAEEIPPETALGFKRAMEELDDLSAQFGFLRLYESPARTKQYIRELLDSAPLKTVRES